jgi:hypothetical protein
MVEGVKRIQAELNVANLLSSKGEVLVKAEVGVIESWTMEEIAFHISEGADWLLTEDAGVKPLARPWVE